MKTEVAPTTTTATTTSRIAPIGAVVCVKFFFLFNLNVWIKVPKYINQYDDIENQTKIMMRFMADLTDIYFLTWNSLRLSIENGWSKSRFFSCQDGSCDGDNVWSTFRDSLLQLWRNILDPNQYQLWILLEKILHKLVSSQGWIIFPFQGHFNPFFFCNLVLNLIQIINILLLLEFQKKIFK